MSTMHVTCFLYQMIVIKHGRLFFKNSSFFKKLQCGILSGPETGRSFRATFWFVFTKPRPTPSACVVPSSASCRAGRRPFRSAWTASVFSSKTREPEKTPRGNWLVPIENYRLCLRLIIPLFFTIPSKCWVTVWHLHGINGS